MICYSFVPSWEIDFIKRDGIRNFGGNVLFTKSEDAVSFARKICSINLPNEIKDIDREAILDSPSIVEQWTYFYLLHVDLDRVSGAEFLKADGILPDIYFTKEIVEPICIRKIEKIEI